MRHMLHNLGFGVKYAAAVDKVLKVHIADIGENNVIGTCNCAQSVHFAEVADAHFNNRKLVMRFETEKRLRQSVFVVEIAFRAENAEFCSSTQESICRVLVFPTLPTTPITFTPLFSRM